jgi:hypothetical protein
MQIMIIWGNLKQKYTNNLNYSRIMQHFLNLRLNLKIDNNQILIVLKIWLLIDRFKWLKILSPKLKIVN